MFGRSMGICIALGQLLSFSIMTMMDRPLANIVLARQPALHRQFLRRRLLEEDVRKED
jgi:hypothetical protein